MTMRDLILAHAPRGAMHARLADVSLPNVDVYFFGCEGRSSGHYLNGRRKSPEALRVAEWSMERALGGLTQCGKPTFDGSLCWNSTRQERGYDRRDEAEGRAFRTCREGYTAIAFWDRTGDKRGASNTVFIAYGELTFSQLVRAAKHAWPEVWARFTFPVVEVDARGQEVRHG